MSDFLEKHGFDPAELDPQALAEIVAADKERREAMALLCDLKDRVKEQKKAVEGLEERLFQLIQDATPTPMELAGKVGN